MDIAFDGLKALIWVSLRASYWRKARAGAFCLLDRAPKSVALRPDRRAFHDGLSRIEPSVKGRKVIVTGAASGMGRATAQLFAREGDM